MRQVLDSLPSQVKLVAVSKYHPAESILEAYEEGQRAFGESHVQELQAKHKVLPEDIEWHFIGHLQTNKVKYVVPYVAMIDAVDSMRLLREINRQAEIITQLRNAENNAQQTQQFAAMLAPLQAQINAIAAKMPNTVPVTYPNVQAVNMTPFYGNAGF